MERPSIDLKFSALFLSTFKIGYSPNFTSFVRSFDTYSWKTTPSKWLGLVLVETNIVVKLDTLLGIGKYSRSK